MGLFILNYSLQHLILSFKTYIMEHLSNIERMTLLRALILAIGHTDYLKEKQEYKELVKKVKAFEY